MGYDYYLTLVTRVHTTDDITIIEHNRFSIEEYFHMILYETYDGNFEEFPKIDFGAYTKKLDNVYMLVLKNMIAKLKITKEETETIKQKTNSMTNVIKIDHTYKFTFRNDDKVIMLNMYHE